LRNHRKANPGTKAYCSNGVRPGSATVGIIWA